MILKNPSKTHKIKECMEYKRRLSRIEKAMKESALQVSKNAG